MHVGVAGLGKMGAAIAHRLIETGNEVTVWNRSAEKCRPLVAAGAAVAASAAGLAGAAETIITTLTDAAAIESVYGGPSGLLAGDVEGKLFIEMSTVRPEAETALAPRVRRHGRGLRRMPGRRHHRAGAPGQAPRPRRRGAGRRRAGEPLLDQLCRRDRALRRRSAPAR